MFGDVALEQTLISFIRILGKFVGYLEKLASHLAKHRITIKKKNVPIILLYHNAVLHSIIIELSS